MDDMNKEIITSLRELSNKIDSHAEKSSNQHLELVNKMHKIDTRVTKIETKGAFIATAISSFITLIVTWVIPEFLKRK